jgi:DNA-binding response OmpR family regulator
MKIKEVVESVLRRVRWDSGVIERGDIRLEARDFGVYRDARLVSELSADQFHLFCLLLEKKQEFVSDEIVSSYVFKEDPESDKSDAVRSLVCRLRKKLGPQLARRIKSSRDKGWIYIQPRDRKTWKIG